MTLPPQRVPSEEILMKVSSDPDIALQQVILDELNRLNREVMTLKAEVARLSGQENTTPINR